MKKKKSKAPVIILIIIITICALGVIAVFLIPEFFPESQYDKLMKKMGRRSRAVGFAVYLDMLERLL